MEKPKFELGQEVWAVVLDNRYKYTPYYSKIVSMSMLDSSIYYNVGCRYNLGESFLYLTKEEAQKKAALENLSSDIHSIQNGLERKKGSIRYWEKLLREAPGDIKKAQEEIKKLEKKLPRLQKKLEKMSQCHTS